MEKIRKTIHKGKEILIIDYSDCKEGEMIAAFDEAKRIVLHDGKHVLILSILNKNNYVTPVFMKHVERELKELENHIAKNAITGLSFNHTLILKGLNLWYKKQIHPFNSVEKAMDFLVE